MMVKLGIEEVSQKWDIIKMAVQRSLPPGTQLDDEYFKRLFTEIAVGEKQVWMGNIDGIPAMVGITQIANDLDNREKVLVIYSAYSLNQEGLAGRKFWEDCVRGFKLYAQSISAKKVIAFTKDEMVIAIAKHCGASDDWHMLEWEVQADG